MEREDTMHKGSSEVNNDDEKVNKILEEIERQSDEIEEIINGFERFCEMGLARRVYEREEIYEGLDPESAMRVGMKPGKVEERFKPLPIYFIPLSPDGSSHLVVDLRGRSLRVYKTERKKKGFGDPYEAQKRYDELMTSEEGMIIVDKRNSDKSLIELFMFGLRVGDIFLSADVRQFSYRNAEEFSMSLEGAIQVAGEHLKKKEEFNNLVKSKLLNFVRRPECGGSSTNASRGGEESKEEE